MDEEQMNELLRRWADTEKFRPSDYRDWNPRRLWHQYGDIEPKHQPRAGYRKHWDWEPRSGDVRGTGTGMRNTKPTSKMISELTEELARNARAQMRPPRGGRVGAWLNNLFGRGAGRSWDLRKMFGKGAGKSLGILGLGIPDELAAGTVEDYFGDTGDLSDEEMMAYYNALIDLGN
jgi:hypothetical protein